MSEIEPVDPLVNEKVMELLASGLRNRKELEARLKKYVINTIFHGQEPPIKSRR